MKVHLKDSDFHHKSYSYLYSKLVQFYFLESCVLLSALIAFKPCGKDFFFLLDALLICVDFPMKLVRTTWFPDYVEHLPSGSEFYFSTNNYILHKTSTICRTKRFSSKLMSTTLQLTTPLTALVYKRWGKFISNSFEFYRYYIFSRMRIMMLNM